MPTKQISEFPVTVTVADTDIVHSKNASGIDVQTNVAQLRYHVSGNAPFSNVGEVINDPLLLDGFKGTVQGIGDFEIIATNPSGYYKELTKGGLYIKPIGTEISIEFFEDITADSTDIQPLLKNALDAGFKHITFTPNKVYRMDSRMVLLDTIHDDITLDFNKATLKCYGAGTTNALYIPAIGDGDAGVAGAKNVTLNNIKTDGANASVAGGIGIKSYNVDNLTINGQEHNNWSLSGNVIYGLAVGEVRAAIYDTYGTGNANHLMAVSTVEVDASRIVIGGYWAHGNGLGFDLSAGSATLDNMYCWNNTNGGMKTAGSDNQHVLMSNCDFSNNTAGTAQGFYTNGSFGLIEMNNVRANNNGSNGMQIAHAGTVLGSNISTNGNGGQGLLQSGDADVLIANHESKGNVARGLLHQAGSLMVGTLRTELNGRFGVNSSSTGAFSVDQYESVDDCDISDNIAMNFQGTGDYHVGFAKITDTRGTPNVTTAINLNASTVDASIGILRTNVATPIADAGTDNRWLDSEGDCKLGKSGGKMGFYGTAPVTKQDITGALSSVTDPNAQALFTSILSFITTTGLGNDLTS